MKNEKMTYASDRLRRCKSPYSTCAYLTYATQTSHVRASEPISKYIADCTHVNVREVDELDRGDIELTTYEVMPMSIGAVRIEKTAARSC